MEEAVTPISLMALPNGLRRCCICFGAFRREECEPVGGEPERVWDVCQGCASAEKARGATF